MANTASSPPPDPLGGESGLLPDDPPHWITFAIAWLVICIFFTALAIAFLVPLPDIVPCPYVLVIEGGADPIQSPFAAIVRKVEVSEGQRVAAGDELFVLSSEEVRGWDTDLRTSQEDLQTKLADLDRDDAADTSEISIKEQEASQTRDEITYRQNYVNTIRQLVDRLEKLSASGAISQDELINQRLELASGEKDLSLAQKSLDQVTLQDKEMQTEHDRRHADALAEIEKLKVHLQALQDEMQNTRQNLRSIRAPYDAVVVSVAERNEGSVVEEGQELCQLARPEAALRARLLLNEPGMPRLSVGQRVRYFAEAFPYQRYGTITGRLEWISPSAVASPQGDQFVAYASLDQRFFLEKGVPHPLQAGMTGQAHIIVGSRTLIEYAFEPIRQLREDARR
jgi:multidrug efflux pump subunit AcrA (membrane-fusion protein)